MNLLVTSVSGKAGICSWPRARLPCPGSFENITEQECNSLSEDCCYENSQTDVSWCYLDTLDSMNTLICFIKIENFVHGVVGYPVTTKLV